MPNENAKKILLTGGGTAGSVTPLLAIEEEFTTPLQSPLILRGEVNHEFLWIGTKSGVEREMVKKVGVEFKAIASGKLRRYLSWRNFIDPFKILIGFFQAVFIILKWKPDIVMSAGGFVSVPVIWAAWLCRVPILIHQQDARPGLANKLMAPFARVVTVTFEKSLADYGKKAVWTGNPVRKSIRNYESRITNFFNLPNDKPVILAVGGGTGAGFLNNLIFDSVEELKEFYNIILITGKDKKPSFQFPTAPADRQALSFQCFEFLDVEQMAEALRLANVVVSRCGMNFLCELSYLGKPSVLIPIPDSHQEENARIFRDQEAAIVLDQKKLTPEELISDIKKILSDENFQKKLSLNIRKVIRTEGAAEKMAEIIGGILGC
jgi:UDP-N-acetylglucosamine--N-acetylmuramyl-(pentapeptide) pyrophosphoryl-undecaprenol N-acetylglucosamine transferase